MRNDLTQASSDLERGTHSGWLHDLVHSLQHRLRPSRGRRPGRPTDESWVLHPKIPMRADTGDKLRMLAEIASEDGKQVSPMHVAAQLLEDALDSFTETRKT